MKRSKSHCVNDIFDDSQSFRIDLQTALFDSTLPYQNFALKVFVHIQNKFYRSNKPRIIVLLKPYENFLIKPNSAINIVEVW